MNDEVGWGRLYLSIEDHWKCSYGHPWKSWLYAGYDIFTNRKSPYRNKQYFSINMQEVILQPVTIL